MRQTQMALVSVLASGCILALIFSVFVIQDFPDHATLWENGAKLACADKLGVFLSLTLCNEANFDPLQRVKYNGLEKM